MCVSRPPAGWTLCWALEAGEGSVQSVLYFLLFYFILLLLNYFHFKNVIVYFAFYFLT